LVKDDLSTEGKPPLCAFGPAGDRTAQLLAFWRAIAMQPV
jgi:hypothetical protein